MRTLSDIIRNKYKKLPMQVAQHSFATLATLIHDGTPRDTGAAQNSWTPKVNGINTSNSGGSYISEARNLKPGDYFTFTSTLSYIRPLEYGWSRQAPSGMVRINVARWKDIVAHSARQVSGI